jgi:hypothetical protein
MDIGFVLLLPIEPDDGMRHSSSQPYIQDQAAHPPPRAAFFFFWLPQNIFVKSFYVAIMLVRSALAFQFVKRRGMRACAWMNSVCIKGFTSEAA